MGQKQAMTRTFDDEPWSKEDIATELRHFLEIAALKAGGKATLVAGADESDKMAGILSQTGSNRREEAEMEEELDTQSKYKERNEVFDPDRLVDKKLNQPPLTAAAKLHRRPTAAAAAEAAFDDNGDNGDGDLGIVTTEQQQQQLDDDSRVERMVNVLQECDNWANYMYHMRHYWRSLDETSKREHSAIGEGLAEMESNVKACHGSTLVNDPSDIASYAKKGKWNAFKKDVETHSRRVFDFVRDIVPKMSKADIAAAERAHDALMPLFVRTIERAEAQVIDRLGGGDVKKLEVKTTPVPVVPAEDLTLERFVTEHAVPGKPVVIRGLNVTPGGDWTLDHLARVCSDVKVQLNTKSTKTTNWGGLIVAGIMPFAEFAREYSRNETLRSWYLHDWSLNNHCPAVFGPPPYENEFVMPKYFAGDYFQRIPWVGYEQTWPSLFIGAKNTSSALHIDSGATNFWMYLMTGRKKWRFWDREQAFNLYLKPMTPHFRFRAFNMNLTRNPLLVRGTQQQRTQRSTQTPIFY